MADVQTLLADAARRLSAAGVGSPRVDAELLLGHVLGTSRGGLLTAPGVSAADAARFAEVLDRRAAREPLQHIVGRAPFRHLELAVGPGVFVPRPETELLVDAVLPALGDRPGRLAVDLCAGSGALGLAIADEIPAARVVLVERSPAALGWLERNAAAAPNVEIVVGDVRDEHLLSGLAGQVDAVVSNPPYVRSAAAVDPEVRADPADAVFAGAEGLDLMPSVGSRAATLLRPGGLLALEHDDTQGESVPALLAADGRWRDIADHRDLAGRPRYTVAFRR